MIKFVELHDKVSFPDAVRQLAARAGLTVPEAEDSKQDAESSREREALLKVHEVAAAWFREQLAAPVGAAGRRLLADRGMSRRRSRMLGMGFAPAAGGLRARLLKEGFTEPLLLKSGLLVQRDEGPARDRFRNRLMIPICRDTGAIIAFGGRAMEAGQQPKYLNSPETAIYVKGRTLYGLNHAQGVDQPVEVRRPGRGLFRLGAGVPGRHHERGRLVRHGIDAGAGAAAEAICRKVVLSFDPDAAGQGAAVRSSSCWFGGVPGQRRHAAGRAMIPITIFSGTAPPRIRNCCEIPGSTWNICWIDRPRAKTCQRMRAGGRFLGRCLPWRRGFPTPPSVTSLPTDCRIKRGLRKR